MRYSNADSINEILANEDLKNAISAVFPLSMFGFFPKEYMDRPLADCAEVIMPWGFPFDVEGFLTAANIACQMVYEHKYSFIGMYKDYEKDYIPDVSANDESSVSLLVKNEIINNCAGEKRPAAIICPGGGYRMLSFYGEGIAYAEKLEEAGYVTFILYYRLNPNLYPAPQNDLTAAIEYVRTHADEYGVDPDNIMCMGSSAGGHLCASTAMLNAGKDNCPNKLCLCYPVISLTEEAHEDSGLALTDNDPELLELLSVEKHVTADYPKTFIWTCADDSLVPPSNTVRMGKALEEAGVEYQCTVYESGEHGCSLGYGTSAEGWIDKLIDYMK